MKITVVTPGDRRSHGGNQQTAMRCARIFRQLGHEARVVQSHDGGDADLMLAIHAWRSAESIERFHRCRPDAPLVVLLAGTDIYRFQKSHPETTRRSMEIASALVGLHDLVHLAIPERFAAKLRVIHQSAQPLAIARARSTRHFDVLVAGHLRDEKDPLRAAYAVRALPEASRLRVVHFGRARSSRWQRAAEAEMARNDRYVWRGAVPHWRIRRAYAVSRVLVLSSVMEGGANVISEAVVAQLPVIASNIEGSIGLLGPDYAGYYRPRDTSDLRRVLLRAETDGGFMRTLERQCRARAPLFGAARERASWRALLEELR